ncbi:MAG: thymidylate synthase [Bacilli bacterium]|nr:thymidylate synthase [Bacilli bacterium]
MIINKQDYKINRATAKVTEWDTMYCQAVKNIIDHGELCENRTGIDTLSLPNVNFSIDCDKYFPILETKKMAIKNTLSELLWIYQAQTNKVSWLQERNNHVWDEWMIDEDGIYRTYEPYGNEDPDREVHVVDVNNAIILDKKAKSKIEGKTIKTAKFFGLKYAGTIGDAYGGSLSKTKEFDRNVLEPLKNNPNDRRKVVNLLQNQFMKTAVLPTCVWASTYKVFQNQLYLDVSARSNDMGLGNPFNITQYAILQALVAKVSNLDIGRLDWHISDCHIYVNQLEGIKRQLERYNILKKWEVFIAENSDQKIERSYVDLLKQQKIVNDKLEHEKYREPYKEIKKEIDTNVLALEHLLTRVVPTLEVANKTNFYDFDNSEHNKDIKVKGYSSLPAIKMPIAA